MSLLDYTAVELAAKIKAGETTATGYGSCYCTD